MKLRSCVLLFFLFSTIALLADAFAASRQAGDVDCKDTPKDVTYVFDAPTKVYRFPDETSPVVGTVKRAQFAQVKCITKGFAQIDLSLLENNVKGWIVGTGKPRENIVDEDFLDVALRNVRLSKTTWSPAVKLDILRKQVRVGFTPEQVTMALGSPDVKQTEETTAGKTEVWAYTNQNITFKKGIVAVIRRTE